MTGTGRLLEGLLVAGARVAWPVIQAVNQRIPGESFKPRWAPAALLKSWQRSKPTLGWPRTTDSLCPTCVQEARRRILSGEVDVLAIVNEHAGEIKAQIVERDGKVVDGEDVSRARHVYRRARDRRRIPRAHRAAVPGPRFSRVTDRLHNHGTSSIKYGRGAVLTVDLTNRCNMMCDPCFMDANQVGLRPRADARRGEEDPRRFDHDQAAPSDDGAVLGRRADDLADLPGVGRVRETGRLLQRPGGDQRHPLRAGSGVRGAGARRLACASRTCSSTASAKRPTRTAKSATCST